MRHVLLGMLLAGILGLLASATAKPPNLLRNGDFAQGLKHWKIEFPESNETKYAANHQWVELAKPPEGGAKALQFTLTPKVAASEGVKATSDLVEVDPEPGKQYEFGADVYSTKPAQILFIEGYERDPERIEAGSDAIPGYVRVFRASLHVKAGKNQWATVSRQFKIPKPKRFRPTHVLVKLYAYHPAGKVWFRNVYLREVEE